MPLILLEATSNIRKYLPYIAVLAAYVAGMAVDVMEIDAAQYAGMGKEVMRTGDYFHFYDHGKGYQDKPPMVFWMSALSFQLFGVSNFAYKLPSVLFSLLAILGTHRLGTLLYNQRIGRMAGLILASTQAFFLMNNDVKTDMYMIGPMIAGLWLLVWWSREGRIWKLLLGSALLGIGMLAKGPIALIVPGFALAADIFLRRDWAVLFRWQWLLVLPIVIVVSLPFLVGQYQQYGWEGITFFFWTQSFGRITGQSEWSNNATAFFFVHSFAWSFLPWTGLFLFAFIRDGVRIVKAKFRLPKVSEGLAFGGFLLVFVALCFSRYKLPHYIFVTYPFAAIVTAATWLNVVERKEFEGWKKFFRILQFVVWILAVLLTAALSFWAFPSTPILVKILFVVAAVTLTVDFFIAKDDWVRFVWPTVLGFALCNLALNLGAYPAILRYQSSAMAGKYVSHMPGEQDVHAFILSGRALNFYAPREALPINKIEDATTLISDKDAVVYTNQDGLDQFKDLGFAFEILETYLHHHPGKLSLMFLNPQTRESVSSPRFLIRLLRKGS